MRRFLARWISQAILLWSCLTMPQIMPKIFSFRLFLFVLGLVVVSPLSATHNRAGEISIEQVGDCVTSLTIKATITTYTKASSVQADRDTLTICWGDGQCERVAAPMAAGCRPVASSSKTIPNTIPT
jgi:hypothetical protein